MNVNRPDQSQLFGQYMARIQNMQGQLQQGTNPQRRFQNHVLPSPGMGGQGRPGIPLPQNPNRPQIQNLPGNPNQQAQIQNLPMQAGQQPQIQNLPFQQNQMQQPFQHQQAPQRGVQPAPMQQQAQPQQGAQRFIQAAIQQGHDPQTVINFLKSKMGGQNAEF